MGDAGSESSEGEEGRQVGTKREGAGRAGLRAKSGGVGSFMYLRTRLGTQEVPPQVDKWDEEATALRALSRVGALLCCSGLGLGHRLGLLRTPDQAIITLRERRHDISQVRTNRGT